MADRKLDFTLFFPEVYQAVAGKDYMVYAYMNDGAMRALDMKPLIESGGVYEPLKDPELFKTKLTVIGYTVAWDLNGTRDEYRCIDVDPFVVFNSPVVDDIPDELF
ncbi:MAG: DUF2442 domain-containing protein [Lachnospiraceae bacterium]|nr:DUF2442 domain-containing protein [Lachnospiraceae bacterium]